jgi:hypothetical protein
MQRLPVGPDVTQLAEFARTWLRLLSCFSLPCEETVQSDMRQDKEQEGRPVTFEHRFPAQMMAIDGTWRRSCKGG